MDTLLNKEASDEPVPAGITDPFTGVVKGFSNFVGAGKILGVRLNSLGAVMFEDRFTSFMKTHPRGAMLPRDAAVSVLWGRAQARLIAQKITTNAALVRTLIVRSRFRD